jgi:hypothetical protein
MDDVVHGLKSPLLMSHGQSCSTGRLLCRPTFIPTHGLVLSFHLFCLNRSRNTCPPYIRLLNRLLILDYGDTTALCQEGCATCRDFIASQLRSMHSTLSWNILAQMSEMGLGLAGAHVTHIGARCVNDSVVYMR